MTTPGELQRELEATFAAEAQERLRNIERDLLALETGGLATAPRELLEALTRDAHSLKGAAQIVGLRDVSLVAHALESRLALTAKTTAAGAPLQALFDAVSGIGRLLDARTAHTVDVPAIVAALGEAGPPWPSAPRPDVIPARRERRPRRRATRGSSPLWDQDTGDAKPDASATHPESGGSLNLAEVETPEDGASSAPASPPSFVPSGGAAGAAESVRVRTARLDALLARGSELLAVRDRAVDLHGELRQLRGTVVSWRKEWQRARGSLDALAGHDPGPLEPVVAFARDAGAHLRHLERDLVRVTAAAGADSDRVAALATRVTDDALELRLVPMATLFDEFPVMVRELARTTGRQVEFQEVGWATEIDRQILERLKDPVMHLLRNAVDHGIEPEAERCAAGKDPVGRVILEAGQRGGGIFVEVRDDGRGIDPARVRSAALRAGVPESELPANSDRAGLTALVMRSGVTTADRLTEVSGRGIGLDVVAEAVARLGGTVSVESEIGRGTTVSLQLPLTLMMAHVVVVRGHTRRYALPIGAVERCIRLGPGDAAEVAGRSTVRLADGPVRLVDLATITGDAPPGGGSDPCRVAAIVRSGGGRIGFLVGAVLEDRQIVARGLGEFATRVGGAPLVAGAAILGDDELALILDPAQLVRLAEGEHRAEGPASAAAAEETREGPASILVVDDSLTTRTLEKSILEAAGFVVGVASDGLAALAALRRERFDVVVTDVDMPRLDGLALTRRIKSDPATRELPVILVTGLESPEQQEQGLLAGADAYLLKSAFDQRALLETIRSLVG